ncbi:serine/threonine protein kinase, partial [Streptomyces daliensis]|nr:serine/threonine protein kinase [Streptomyces daliensis]
PDGHAPASRAAKERARARRWVLASVLVLALVGGGVAIGLAVADRDEGGKAPGADHSQGQDQGQEKTPDDARDKKGEAGGAGTTPTSKPEPAPSGYRTVDDPAGFKVAVPKGFTRSYEPPRVFYYSPGKEFRLGVYIQDQEPGGPVSAMKKADEEGPHRYPGYRGGVVRKSPKNEFPGALWEFTWNGESADGGPRHTFDQSWDEAGKMYDLWVSAPSDRRPDAKRHFDTALKTFVRTKPH